MGGEPENRNGQLGRRRDTQRSIPDDDVLFKQFVRTFLPYFGVLLTPFAAQFLKLIPIPSDHSNLAPCSSLISLIAFCLVYSFKPAIASVVTAEGGWRRFVPQAVGYCTALSAIWLTAVYHTWLTKAAPSETWLNLVYLVLVPLYITTLTIALLVVYSQRVPSQPILLLLCGRLRPYTERITKMLEDFSKFAEISLKNDTLKEIGRERIGELERDLEELAGGQISVPGDQIPRTVDRLLRQYPHGFYAVSDEDIELFIPRPWDINPTEYFKSHAEAVLRGTPMARIFIFSQLYLRNRLEEISKVLVRHEESGIGWGVAIREALPQWLKQQPKDQLIDFALLDGNKGFLVFRNFRQAWRKLKLVLSVNQKTQILVQERVEIFETLTTNCWLVNQPFKVALRKVIERKQGDIRQGLGQIKNLAGNKCQLVPGRAFPLEVDDPPAIEHRLKDLNNLAEAYVKRYSSAATDMNFDERPGTVEISLPVDKPERK